MNLLSEDDEQPEKAAKEVAGMTAGEEEKESKTLEFYGGKLVSAVPLLFFVLWAIVVSTQTPSTPGLALGAIIGLVIGMFLYKGDWSEYANSIFEGMAQPIGVIAIVCWFWAGMFSSVLQAGQFVNGLVWLGDVSGATGSVFTALTFLLAAILATAIGTGYGTTTAFTLLVFPAGLVLGANPVILFGAILSGAAFGDNLAPVSDTTIVSAVTQKGDVGGVVRSRFKYAIIAAVPAFILYLIVGGGGADIGLAAEEASNIISQTANPQGLILFIPFFTVVGLALSGRHIVEALTWGILLTIIIGIPAGLMNFSDVILFNPSTGEFGGALLSGITGYFPMAILIIMLMASMHIFELGGGAKAFLQRIMDFATTVKRAEFSIWLMIIIPNILITINTAAEILVSPFVREVGERFNLHEYRRANFLDANTSALGYIFPWGGGVLAGFAAMEQLPGRFEWFTQDLVVSPAQVWPYVFHGWILAFVVFLGMGVMFGYGREYIYEREIPEGARMEI